MDITIENVIVTPIFYNGVHTRYTLDPVDGYVLHDNARDWMAIDPDTMEETLKLGYTRGQASCGANYDFVANPREFYAVPEDSVPADQIFGVTQDHEVM